MGTHVRSSLVLLACMLLLAGCQRSSLRRSLLEAQAPTVGGEAPLLLAVYQPWFGNGKHMDVGYSTQDPKVIRRQIEEARNLGISGFVVNWYGPRHEFEDRSYALIQRIAAETGFKVALQYDEAIDTPNATTEAVLVDLQSAYDHYISPSSPQARATRKAYLRYQGKPVIFIFPKAGDKIDWARVRTRTRTWEDPPLLIYKDGHPRYAAAFDGFYPWVQPGKGGWAPDGSRWGDDYLRAFYEKMRAKHPDKIAVGGVWPGFDDRRASWSGKRLISPRCGKTFEELMQITREFARTHTMPFILVQTWNDYEEGTAVENGLPGC